MTLIRFISTFMRTGTKPKMRPVSRIARDCPPPFVPKTKDYRSRYCDREYL